MPNYVSRAGSAAVLTALAALVLGGCSHDETPPNTTVVAPTPPAAPVVATTPGAPGTTVTGPGTPGDPSTKVNVNAGPGTSTGTDTATAEAVNKAIVTNKQMTGSRIEAVVTGGVCTLTGITQNASQKGIAEQSARRVAGVTQVKNKIEIRPTGGAGKTVAAKPATKVIVINRTVPASPAAPAAPAPPAPPAVASSGHKSGAAAKGHAAPKGGDTTASGSAGGTDNTSDSTTTDTTTNTTTTGNGQ